MSVFEAILARRSVRAYQSDRAVPRSMIETLLRAAMAAPSAMNKQPWEFIVVDEREPLMRLAKALPFGQYGAPAAVIVCGNLLRTAKNAEGYWVEDCSAAIENMLLAATEMGLGTCWIGAHPVEQLVSGIRRAFRLPTHIRPLGVVLVGYADGGLPPARTQYDSRRVHYQRFYSDALPQEVYCDEEAAEPIDEGHSGAADLCTSDEAKGDAARADDPSPRPRRAKR